VVRRFGEFLQGFGHSALKLIGKPFVLEQIEVGLARVGLYQTLGAGATRVGAAGSRRCARARLLRRRTVLSAPTFA
jgi:hypothetical protein